MKKLQTFLLTLLLTSVINAALNEEAVIIVPVADLLGQSMKSFMKEQKEVALNDKKIEEAYQSILKVNEGKEICPRIYQLLFNERVIIQEEDGAEVKIEVPYAQYGINKEGKLASTYWTLKKNTLKKNDISVKTFNRVVPHSITSNNSQQKNITLLMPYTNTQSALKFSAGTRFMIHGVTPDKDYVVIYLDPKSKKPVLMKIPKKICRENPQSKLQAQKEYVQLMRSWAKYSMGQETIPYVWGGASFLPDPGLKIITGFDCAGLIIRAAQSRSIPFYLKNSSAQKYHLKEINNLPLDEGDILWIPGHMMVISDLKGNKIIESRGYSSGYGRLHEIPLSIVFKQIDTYDDLLEAYRKKKPLELLDKDGKVTTKITDYRLLKFSSIWQL